MMLKNEVARTNTGRVGALAAIAFLTGSLLTLGGCGSGGSVSGGGDLIDQMTQGLTGGSFDSINGFYGPDCTDRFPGDWSVAVNGSTTGLDNPALSVVVGDTNCALFVTSLW